ncbi:HAD-IA family hydrolase [Brachyspira hyodysenteriae]|uniref:HAD superfamily hydrolase n=3 Tax=Brachyspira hyodysenteriae TaxID=159 RepID=A0A3B6V9U4_BRAHW|nr:HAD-IA family hydrolase [Brachyspira hyodysenteriae]ACN83879.1 HAD superfamily hydrolase [Brachyspira hyodysenteriae WA1]ANN64006.1 haloacid dehalogenase [Brachyspira hyodysenteriae ATCC 27164]AUJ49606.1 haloacid dehalogenase [Brachyspira hyodysenteriae]KLI17188.1 haloacid dehalogenase [Brachyspira hyodysenteriae]KLI25348.1 haloacid dehalogenase [Brachyspira hyodysenteriae]
MIKNIVSDIGNVLYEFNVNEFMNKYIDEEDREKFFQNSFSNKNWHLMDKGDLDFNDARKLFIDMNPKYQKIIDELFDTSLTLCLNKNHNNISLLKEYKNKGYDIYYLSNMPSETFEALRKETDFFDDTCIGGVVSAHIKMIKPNKDIYEYFLNKFDLKADECLFIDDNINNVNAALDIGIKAVQLKKIDDMKDILQNMLK